LRKAHSDNSLRVNKWLSNKEIETSIRVKLQIAEIGFAADVPDPARSEEVYRQCDVTPRGYGTKMRNARLLRPLGCLQKRGRSFVKNDKIAEPEMYSAMIKVRQRAITND
jgi:hypothetical protein